MKFEAKLLINLAWPRLEGSLKFHVQCSSVAVANKVLGIIRRSFGYIDSYFTGNINHYISTAG